MALLSSGRIITFYSYKGGTGRSMALANVAWVLASSGARVLVVDWDLEAPGLHRYFRPFLNDKELIREESAGLIDFMTDFVQTMATPLQPSESRKEDWYEKHADISKWTKRLLWPSGEDAKTGMDSSRNGKTRRGERPMDLSRNASLSAGAESFKR